MNLVRAVSLSGGAADLQGDDSTKLICRIQLIVLAVDFVFNILADTFLRDPLLLLVIFICQVFLLIVGFIFYIMASANQAMKEGIHDKLLRHHQVTAFLWTTYVSMLLWWYIWSLKRSWPSAGDHFSFTLHRDARVKDFSPNNELGLFPVINGSIENLGIIEADEKSDALNSSDKNLTSSQLTTQPGGIQWAAMLIRSIDLSQSNSSTKKKHIDIAEDRVNRTLKEELKFFWSPGFIALYVCERSISMLFYTANILGTLHILNAHAGEDEDKNFSLHNSRGDGPGRRKESAMRDGTTGNRAKQFKFESPRRRKLDDHLYFESDSNLDDNGDSFIRQLEDQDGDPFENDQYNYSYRYGSKPAFVNERNVRSSAVVTETETDEGDSSLQGSAVDSHTQEYHRYHDKRRKKPSNKALSKGKSVSSRPKQKGGKEDSKSKKSKGSLRNMMIMAHLGKSNMGQSWPGNDGNSGDGSFLRRKDPSPVSYRRMPSTGDLKARCTTTSASVEMIGTGSTDELLVAQVVSVHDSSSAQGYSNPWISSDEKIADKRERTDSV